MCVQIKKHIVKIIFAIYILVVVLITQLPVTLMFGFNPRNIHYNLRLLRYMRIQVGALFTTNVTLASVIENITHTYGYNIILFLPMGFLLPLLNKKFHGLLKTTFSSCVFSICIEILQLIVMATTMTNCRCFDVDDILANTVGGIIGFGFYRVFKLITSNSFSEKI